MNKLLSLVFTLIMTIGAMTGCSSEEQYDEGIQEQEVKEQPGENMASDEELENNFQQCMDDKFPGFDIEIKTNKNADGTVNHFYVYVVDQSVDLDYSKLGNAKDEKIATYVKYSAQHCSYIVQCRYLYEATGMMQLTKCEKDIVIKDCDGEAFLMYDYNYDCMISLNTFYNTNIGNKETHVIWNEQKIWFDDDLWRSEIGNN